MPAPGKPSVAAANPRSGPGDCWPVLVADELRRDWCIPLPNSGARLTLNPDWIRDARDVENGMPGYVGKGVDGNLCAVPMEQLTVLPGRRDLRRRGAASSTR